MELRLQYPPTPEAAPKHAGLCVSAALEVEGVELDYSVDSLAKLDGIIENLRQDGVTSDEVAETLFTFGCYVGEVFVRNAGGRWCSAEGTPMAGATGFPLIVQLGSGGYCNPIGKVFKRLEQGPEHNLSYFYQVFTSPEASAAERAPGRR
ncbi:hypothetical protein [Archangium sp.]|uniref:hypothetical protein n=1 Tax=Archangium sp. TaxID=1872627 RepID=UPI002D5CC9B4|nr:hypothetical protein [Archangium sp.]HYO58832.1 hypothetical protein [Archangium sp.]